MVKYNPKIFKVWRYISKKRKIQFLFMIVVMIISGISELFTLAAVIPFLSIITNPESLVENWLGQYLLV